MPPQSLLRTGLSSMEAVIQRIYSMDSQGCSKNRTQTQRETAQHPLTTRGKTADGQEVQETS